MITALHARMISSHKNKGELTRALDAVNNEIKRNAMLGVYSCVFSIPNQELLLLVKKALMAVGYKVEGNDRLEISWFGEL